MDAEELMADVSEENEWPIELQLELALQYINNQSDPDAFEEFLVQVARAEKSSSYVAD